MHSTIPDYNANVTNNMMDLDQPDEFRYTISTISGMVNSMNRTNRAGFAPRSERGNRVRNLLQRKVRRSINPMDSITDYMPELAIDVQVTETGTEIVIRNPVNTFYRTILRDTQHVLYGWLAPFKELGISLMGYLQTTELLWKNLQGDIKSLVQPAVMTNYYDNNIQIIAKGRADLIYDIMTIIANYSYHFKVFTFGVQNLDGMHKHCLALFTLSDGLTLSTQSRASRSSQLLAAV